MWKTCQNVAHIFNNPQLRDEIMLCAGGKKKDSCHGDSGGNQFLINSTRCHIRIVKTYVLWKVHWIVRTLRPADGSYVASSPGARNVHHWVRCHDWNLHLHLPEVSISPQNWYFCTNPKKVLHKNSVMQYHRVVTFLHKPPKSVFSFTIEYETRRICHKIHCFVLF